MDFDRQYLIRTLRRELRKDAFWERKLAPQEAFSFTLHLAVLREPYLKFILEGKKTIETRFAKRPCAPFEKVGKGDVIMLKRTPGDVMGVCVVEEAWFYRVNARSLKLIKSEFGEAICAAPSFWEERQTASVATLLLIGNVTRVKPLKVQKRDRRGWVVFKQPGHPALFST
jgi:hypothetical protein